MRCLRSWIPFLEKHFIVNGPQWNMPNAISMSPPHWWVNEVNFERFCVSFGWVIGLSEVCVNRWTIVLFSDFSRGWKPLPPPRKQRMHPSSTQNGKTFQTATGSALLRWTAIRAIKYILMLMWTICVTSSSMSQVILHLHNGFGSHNPRKIDCKCFCDLTWLLPKHN